jgi:hypothetical protein
MGRVFAQALPYIPRPGVGKAEGEFTANVSGSDYLGFIDLQCMIEDLPGSDDCDMPVVIDYKTKATIRRGDRRNVLEGPGDFLDDPQAILYAAKALVQHKADKVHLRWIYLQAEGKPKAFCSDATLSKGEVSAAFGRIVHPIAKQLDALRPAMLDGTLDPLTLPPTPATCRKYGEKYACPYESVCNLPPGADLAIMDDENTQGDTDMDLLAKLQNQAKTTTQPQAETKPAPVAPPVAEAPKGINPPKPMPEKCDKPAECKVPAAVADASDAELGRALRVLIKAWGGK